VGRARRGIGGLARRIRPVGRLSVGLVPDGRGHLVASGGHLERQVLHALRFEPDFTAAVPRPVAIWYASWPDAAQVAVQVLDNQWAPSPPGAVRAPAPHIPAYLIGYQDGRRELLNIFAEHSARADELAAVSTTFAQSVGWNHRVVWAKTFRASPALANVEFLRGYAGCPVPAGLGLAIDLALNAAGGCLALDALATRAARATGFDQRLCRSAILRLAWERRLMVDVTGAPIGSQTAVSSAPS
jgi:hypothetical protein